MAQKKYLISIGIIALLAIIISFYWKHTYPSNEEKAYHRTAMCYVISHQNIQADNNDLMEYFHKIAKGGVPDYALNQPKVYDQFAHKMIGYYLSLPPEKQKLAQSDGQACDQILQAL